MLQIKNNTLKLSVRAFVEFLCQSGDIDNRFGGISDKTAMEAGSKAHRKIQKSMGPEYHSEVPLKLCLPGDEYEVVIEGRADGVFISDGITYIDEIKGTYKNIRYINEAIYVHKAQAMCYAYIYSKKENVEKIGVRNTYVNLETEEVKYIEEIMTIEELEEWFLALVDELRKWGDFLLAHQKKRDESINALEFPFEYREGQKNLAVSVYKSIARESNLFIQAPTGVGKTISTIFPTVKAMGSGLSNKIFYLTAKTITRTAAEDAYMVLRNKGLVFKSATITAKEKVCFINEGEGCECNPLVCPYAKGHFDRVNDAVYDIITNEDVINRQKIEEYANKHTVCPFEFGLDVTYWVDGVICDYNYVFDPHVYLKRYFSEGMKRDYVFLVDEAHNLVDRARKMYSAEVIKEDFLAMKRLVEDKSKRLTNALERCNKDLLAFKRECHDGYKVISDEDAFAHHMLRLAEEISLFMEKNKDFPYMKELLEFFFKVKHYNDIHEELDENYIVYTEHVAGGFMLKLFCVNPSGNLKRRIDFGKNAVFFSATLLPINYYKELLSGNVEDYAIYAHSIFDTSKRLLVVGNDVTSRYTKRTESEFEKIHQYIHKIAKSKQGNYLVFFPSYKYMESVASLCEKDEDIRYVIQNSKMSEEEKENFLKEFDDNREETLVGLCVMGGIFSEGIDLKHDSLIGAVIVGTGIPSIDTEQQLLRQYFDAHDKNGYEYAFTFPGMNKVLQAAGRVIRTEEDTGVIALLDDRFLNSTYKKLFPREWEDYKIVNVKTVQEEILDFWRVLIYN